MNKVKTILLGMATSVAMAGSISSHGQEEAMRAQAVFLNTEGKEIGGAILTETPHGVLIEFTVNNLPRGEHGFHIHETGSCEIPDFQSAGGHYNPHDKKHGYLIKDGYHAGDLPNQFIGADGLMRGSLFNPNITLSESDTSLFDFDGSALVVHAEADDYSSQPAGAAGTRIACAVIKSMPPAQLE
jgi:superoxide dismutase, Cu-Zn family